LSNKDLFNKQRPENGELIGPAQGHGPSLCNTHIPQAAIDMQRINIMFQCPCHHDHAPSINPGCKNVVLKVDSPTGPNLKVGPIVDFPTGSPPITV
jgi:hypothetical protein